MMLSNVAVRLVGAAAFAFAALMLPSCASEESILFAVPDGGASGEFNTTSGGPCSVDPNCKVKFSEDIFKKIIDGSAGCTGAALCHGGDDPQGDLVLKPGESHAAYEAFLNYQLKKTPGPGGPYLTACQPENSSLLCNTALSDGDNPYKNCGTLMPFGKGATKLTTAQLQTIAEWITCGAPDN